MDRRSFLKMSAAAGAATATGACRLDRSEAPDSPAAGTGLVPTEGAFRFEEWTVTQLSRAMSSGAETARSITSAYLERLEAIDTRGPMLRSVITVNPDALEVAEALDRERHEGQVRGPLHGVPVMIKDNIDTADRMATTAGSLALAETIPPEDAFIVGRLREAGAVILGKTNLSEWANFRSTRSSSGWSAVGGQVKNPFVLDRSPCGSSAGSGAAASANLCALAVGTETDGSVVCPSSANGIVGVKPTLGLVSRRGIVPIAHSQDTAGPMCRTVEDAALLLAALSGVDARDPATTAAADHIQTDYLSLLDAAALRAARIGVWRDRFGFHDRVDVVLEEGLAALRAAGAELIDVEMPSISDAGDAEFEVLLYEFKADLAAYLAVRGEDTKVRSLADLIRFNQEHAAEEMPYFGQEIFEMAESKGPLTDKAYRDALAKCRKLTRDDGIDRVLAEHRLDAIVAPTGGPAWTIDLVNGDHFGGGSSTAAAVSGYANVTVPAGFVHGLPVGLSFIGGPWSEPRLLALAYAFEQATQIRRPPRFAPRVEAVAV